VNRGGAQQWWLATVAAGTLAISIGACGEDSSGGEGEALTVYSGREEEYVGPLFDQFTEETGIEVEIKYGESAELAATLAEEGENSPADLFFSQDAGSLGAVEGEELFSALPEPVLETVDERYRSAEGEWVGTSGRARVVGYNTEALSDGELPESILDFTAPEWKGRIGWAPTNGSFQAFVTAMRLTEGEEVTREWVEGIVANEPEELSDNEAIRDAIAAGEVDVGFLNHYYIAEAQAEAGEGYPVASHYTSGDAGSLVNVAGVGVLASSDQADDAVALAEFMLSEQAQSAFAEDVKEYPLIDSVEVDPLIAPLEEIEQPDVELAELDDLEGTLTLLQEAGAL